MLYDHDAPDSDKLFVHFGTTTPRWRLTNDSNALSLSSDAGTVMSVALTQEQADGLREMTGVISHRMFDINLFNETIPFHLVGRKVTGALWQGTVADYHDTDAVAHNLEDGIRFAEQVVSEVNSLVIIIDEDFKLRRFNRLCEEVTGFKEEDLLGRDAHAMFMQPDEIDASRANIQRFFSTKQAFQVERSIRTHKGVRQILWRNQLVRNSNGANERFLVCSGTDVTEERYAQAQLLALANTDDLTGLPNRHSMKALISQRVAETTDGGFSLIFLDLDNFKKINDHYGHMVGDQLLRKVAEAIKGCLDDGDTLARLGGDEFLILARTHDIAEIEATAQRILTRMQVPFPLNLVELYSGCSIGVAMFPEHGKDMDELIRNADTAMYVAKDEGRQTFRLFSPVMHERVASYVWLDHNLRRAIAENQFELFYQPKIDLATNQVASVEALIRWNSPERGRINPLEFIPYAEESGLIVPLGQWVIEESARQISEWSKKGLDLRVALNLSVRQLRHPSLVQEFTDTLNRYRIFPSKIDLEITESCFMDDESMAETLLQQFRDLGARIHLDDFGTGYSSLSKLTRLPIDVVKMDRSFIGDLHTDPKAQGMVRAMVGVGRELGLRIIAEGVETQAQAEFLKNLNVSEAQGYLYARPMPAAELEMWAASYAVALAKTSNVSRRA